MQEALQKLTEQLENCIEKLEEISEETYNIQRSIEEAQDDEGFSNIPEGILEEAAEEAYRATDQIETAEEEAKKAIDHINNTIQLLEKINQYNK